MVEEWVELRSDSWLTKALPRSAPGSRHRSEENHVPALPMIWQKGRHFPMLPDNKVGLLSFRRPAAGRDAEAHALA